MNNRLVAVATDTKGLDISAATSDAILSNCRMQIELDPGQQSEQNQLLELHNTGHCGATVTANYDHVIWERFQSSSMKHDD
ncbi:hypothetical protein NPS53_09625 [Pseudomonas putida]|uniref:hypothetical protein n=1 Tax=Pseudomonas putida TaxID=303 RepID=UPI0023635BA7|nr:hypothetical protein [Pseudomonas putida]MDD2139837.1 hypothetical protein [Pseudomonas putida]HDS1721760.1 hypothetical protein [Pseudomonas putida]